jgi:hypothetical protein
MSPPPYSPLTPAQIQELCRFCKLDPATVIMRTNGAHRDALMAPGRVYFFPRTPAYAASTRYEMNFLKAFGGWPGVPMPRFLDVIQCPAVFAGDIGVVSRLPGENWEDIQSQPQFTWEFMDGAFEELADLMAIWHGTPPAAVPSPDDPDQMQKFSEQPRMQAWLAGTLHPATAAVTVRALHAEILTAAAAMNVSTGGIEKDAMLDKWVAVIAQIAALPHVLLHADMHEGQILLDLAGPRKITGILDWEAVQFGNPIEEFSFHKWGWGKVWEFRAQFPALRRKLWGRYVERRGLRGELRGAPDSLHLYCTLTEVLRTLMERDENRRPRATVTRQPYADSLAEQFETLRAATEHV